MKENMRVRLSILVWGALVILLFMGAAVVFSNLGTTTPKAEERSLEYEPQLQSVASEYIDSGVYDGVAIAIIERGGLGFSKGYGSLADDAQVELSGLEHMGSVIPLLAMVEQGEVTLEEVVECLSAEGVWQPFLLSDAIPVAVMLLNDGVVEGDRALSVAAVRALLTSDMGWTTPHYMSLLSDKAVEKCANRCAMVVDGEQGMAIIIVVDSPNLPDMAIFSALRSRVASIASAIERETSK